MMQNDFGSNFGSFSALQTSLNTPLLSLVSFGRLPVEPLGSFLRFLGAHGSARGFSKEVAKVALIYIHVYVYIYMYTYTYI